MCRGRWGRGSRKTPTFFHVGAPHPEPNRQTYASSDPGPTNPTNPAIPLSLCRFHPKSYNKSMSEANDLTNQILDHLYKHGAYGWKATTTGVYDTKKGNFRAASKKGVADILGCHKGILLAIEIKIGKDRLSDEQEGFLKNIAYHGGKSVVAKDFESFYRWWSEQFSP